MRKPGNFLLVIFLLIVCLSNIPVKKNSPSFSNSCNCPLSAADDLTGYNFNLQDSNFRKPLLKHVEKKLPKKIKPANFIQKLLAAFKFKKNANFNEQLRVKAFLDTLRIDTNLVISMENIRLLDTAISKSDSTISSVLAQLESVRGKLQRYNENEQVNFVVANNRFVQSQRQIDSSLGILAAKMNSIISVAAAPDASAKRARLNFIQSARDSSNFVRHKIDTLIDPETKKTSIVFKNYQLRIKNKAEVYGIYDIATLHTLNTTAFNQLNYLMLNSIPVTVTNMGKIDQAATKIKASEDYITEAIRADCKIGVTFRLDSTDQKSLTKIWINQKVFIRNAMVLLSTLHASAVNISIDSLPEGMESDFLRFIQSLSRMVKIQNPSIQLMLTLPANQNQVDFPLLQLTNYVDRFIIDFSRNYFNDLPVAMAALSGENQFTIETVCSWYKSQQVPFSKIVIQLPYTGTAWAFSKTFVTGFLGYVPYNDIRQRYENYFYNYYKHYNPDSTIVMMDSVINENPFNGVPYTSADGKKDTLPNFRIYLDDAVSLGKKYQYIIDNNLGGVAINSLGNDNGYSDLSDELIYRFADTFTRYLPDSLVIKRERNELKFYERWSRYYSLFKYIMDNPCETCFENMEDTAQLQRYHQYMFDLGIDTMLKEENKKLLSQNKDIYRSHYEFVNHLLSRFLKNLTWIFFIPLVILVFFYFYKNRYFGDSWKYKKAIGYLAVALTFLFILALFSYLFSSDKIPYFGSATSSSTGFSQDSDRIGNANDVIRTTDDSFCNTDRSDCYNMPLSSLLLIVMISLLIGFAVTRYLVINIVKQKDIP